MDKAIKRNLFWILIIILTGLIVGALYACPQLLIKRAVKESGQVYLPLQVVNDNNDEAMCYAPRAREIYDGYFPPGDLYIKKNKNLPTLLPYLGETLFSSLIYFSSGDITSARLLAWFIFPIFIFFFFYILALVFLREKIWAWFFALLAVLTPIVTAMPEPLLSLNKFINIAVKSLVPYINTTFATLHLGEIVDPLTTYIIFIPAIISVYIFWQRPSKINAIFAGVLVGLLFYTYFYYWIFLGIIMFLLFSYSLFKAKEDKQRIVNFIYFIIIVLFFAVPYLINYYQFNQLPQAQDIIARFSVENGRHFRWIVWKDYLLYIILAVLVYFSFWKKEKKKSIFFLAALLTMAICWNLQLITGFMPHPDHWFRTYSPILFIISFNLAYLAVNVLVNKINRPQFKKIIIYGIIILGSFIIFKKSINLFYYINPPKYDIVYNSMDSEIIESWEWINNNLESESIVISPSFITSMYIPLYTSSSAYLPFACNSMSSNREIEDRYLAVNKLFGVQPKRLENFLRSKGEYTFNNTHSYRNLFKAPLHIYYNYYRDQSFNSVFRKSEKNIPNKKIKELIKRYDYIEANWSDFKGEYIYYGPSEQEIANDYFFNENLFEEIFSNNKVKIYLVK